MRIVIQDSNNESATSIIATCNLNGAGSISSTSTAAMSSNLSATAAKYPDGSYHCALSGTMQTAPSNLRLVVEMIGGNGSVIYQGDGASGLSVRNIALEYQSTTPIAVPSLSINASPASIANGAQSTINWSAQNISSCALSGSGITSSALSGSQSTGALFGNAPYLLTCQTSWGQTFTASTTVAVALRTSMPVLPDTTNSIGLGQGFNYNVANPNTEIGKVDIVWGAASPSPSSIYNLHYYPFERDQGKDAQAPDGTGTINVAWFYKYHPDWIEYTCGAANTTEVAAYGDPFALAPNDPHATSTTDIAFEYYYDPTTKTYGSPPGGYVPLDIANPAVLQFMFDRYLQPAIAAGYQGIAFDNVTLRNPFHRCGHFTLAGQWVQQYSGSNLIDNQYMTDVLNWASWMFTRLHAINASVVMNFSYPNSIVNNAQGNNLPQMQQLLQYMDVQLPEGGFSGDPGVANWTNLINFEQYAQAKGTAVFLIDYFEEGPPVYPTGGVATPADLQAHSQWTLANYLLLKETHTYFTLTSDGDDASLVGVRATLSWIRPEYTAANVIGHAIPPVNTPSTPCGISRSSVVSDPTAPYCSQGVYMRDYSNGKAIVNPDPNNSYTITLPSGYTDLYGNAVPTSLTLAPDSGIVMLGVPAAPLWQPATNLLSSAWSVVNIAPATLTGSSFSVTETASSTNAYHQFQQYLTTPSASAWSFSLDATPQGSRSIRLVLQDTNNESLNSIEAICNLSGQGSVSGVSAAANSGNASATATQNSDGSYHCTLSGTVTNTPDTKLRVVVQLVDNGSVIYAGDGSSGVSVKNIVLQYRSTTP